MRSGLGGVGRCKGRESEEWREGNYSWDVMCKNKKCIQALIVVPQLISRVYFQF